MSKISLVPYKCHYGVAAVKMWRDSKEHALGISELHSFQDQLDFLNNSLCRDNVVYLAILGDQTTVAGLLATDGSRVNQLYVHIEHQKLGIGTQLLDLAKAMSTGELELFTFAANTAARAFYEKHGFEVVGRGCDNEEGLPHIEYRWNQPTEQV
ncbi:MAG: GNAT family N-acetyltransferase [Pseudomonadota bacterium]